MRFAAAHLRQRLSDLSGKALSALVTGAKRRPAGDEAVARRSFGLNDLDLKLYDAIGEKRGGTFIEVGANNGIAQSNTVYFERYLGWRGLLIEAVPALALQCRKNRPQARVVNAALVPFGFRGKTVGMRYCNLMSTVKGAMKTDEEELAHIRAGCEVQKIESYDVTVPALTLQSILDKYRICEVDLFSLDVEGFEANVLGGLDLDRFVARNLLIEARYRDDIERVLAGRYVAVAELSHHDVLYRPVPELNCAHLSQ